ncbi:outer membrane protein transport protein [Vibrio sp. LaRot3]|nr:outer membrane protein transport protein [Vibrio sp. LaRot3]MDA0147817.1 outer membrane protein transport protein [Vibrio sp. LaRot3]
MTNKFTLSNSALLIGAALISAQANAAGFQLNAQSATGIGRAFAGDAVIADNASVMARNPAAMALFDETALSLGFETIITDIEVKDSTYTYLESIKLTNPNRGPQYVTEESNYDNAGGTSIAPNIHLIVPIDETFAVGVNAYSNFGTSTEFDSSFAASEYGGTTDVMSMNIGLSGSYRLNQQWSFGAGLDLIYGKGELERTLNDGIMLYGGETGASASADGWALGFNLGTVYELNENNRFGFSYRYSPEIEAEGEVEYLLSGLGKVEDTLYLSLPHMVEFSGYHRIENSKFAVHYSVQYIGWSVFEDLEAEKSGVLNEYKWQDGMHYAIGGTYYLNNDWTLRAGYMYDTSAQDELTSVSVPDSDRQWFSAGFTYHINAESNIDFGFTYLMGKDVDVHESLELDGMLVSEITATTRANAILVGLQYSRTF